MCLIMKYSVHVWEIHMYEELEGITVELVSIIIRGAFTRCKLVVGHAQLNVLIGRPVHRQTVFDERSKRRQTTLLIESSDIISKASLFMITISYYHYS